LVEDVEAKSTVSSLTNDFFPSFDKLQKMYTNGGKPKDIFGNSKVLVNAEHPSSGHGDHDISWMCRAHTQNEISEPTRFSKKKIVVAVVVLCLAVIAVVASTSLMPGFREISHTPGVDTLDSILDEDELEIGQTEDNILSKPLNKSPRPSSKGSKEAFLLVTSQASGIAQNTSISITSKSDESLLNQSNQSTFDLKNDDFDQSSTAFSISIIPSYALIQSPTQFPSNYQSSTQQASSFETSTPTYFPSVGEKIEPTPEPSRVISYTEEPTLLLLQ
jgi:hypothetical protein